MAPLNSSVTQYSEFEEAAWLRSAAPLVRSGPHTGPVETTTPAPNETFLGRRQRFSARGEVCRSASSGISDLKRRCVHPQV